MAKYTGTAGNDTLRGTAEDDELIDDLGGNDSLYGEGGNDILRVLRNGQASTLVLDGGTGDDFIEFIDFGFLSSVTLNGGDGADIIRSFGGGTVTINAGAGSDHVTVDIYRTNYTITLGAGSDLLTLDGVYSTFYTSNLVVTDFQTGAGGDQLGLSDFLRSELENWNTSVNPFAAGFLRLTQSGADTLLQIDIDGFLNGSTFTNLVRFANVTQGFTAFNLGYDPTGGATTGQTFTGTNGRDVLTGTSGNDTLNGLGGDDSLFGGAGDDLLYGGDGFDTLDGQLGNDKLYGGAGNDVLVDRLGGNDELYGEDGDDVLSVERDGLAAASSVKLDGGAGNDRLEFTSTTINHNATLIGGSGDDVIVSRGGGAIVIDAGAGNDDVSIDNYSTLFMGGSTYTISLGAGQDTLTLLGAYAQGFTGTIRVTDFTTGDSGDRLGLAAYLQASLEGWDRIASPFSSGYLRLRQTGNDTILDLDVDGGGNSFAPLIIFSGANRDSFTSYNLGGYSNAAVFIGTDGNDQITGTSASETFFGYGGDDVLNGGAGSDVIRGGLGNDYLIGGYGDDFLFGDEGDDVLAASYGNDTIDGGVGTDTLVLTGSLNGYFGVATAGYFRITSAFGSHLVRGVEQVSISGSLMSMTDFIAQAFDGLRYIASNGDLIRGLGPDAEAGRQHWIRAGSNEGRSLTAFNPLGYVASNPDLIPVIGVNPQAAATHYIRSGFTEGRRADLFDPLRYLASNRDLIVGFGADTAGATTHYIQNGYREGRSYTTFDALRYIASNGDLIGGIGANVQAATMHYINHGSREGRGYTAFDALRYIASNGDLIGGIGANVQAGTIHYINHGYREGRPLSSFDPLKYVATYNDLIQTIGVNAQRGLEHYIQTGYAEGRKALFDPVAYLLSNGDLAAAGLGTNGALNHWIRAGSNEGRLGDALFGREQGSHSLSVGNTLVSALETPGDRDWFQLQFTNGETVRLTLDATGFDGTLAVHDSLGRRVAFANDPGDDTALAFTASGAGIYYVVVDSATHNGAGTYTLIAEPTIG